MSDLLSQLLGRLKSDEKVLNDKWKEFVFYHPNSCTICLKELKDGEGEKFDCKFSNRDDRLCKECVDNKDFYMIQVMDFHDGNRPITSTLEMDDQMSLGKSQDYYLNTNKSACLTCSMEYQWLVFMNTNGDVPERCQSCNISFPRHYLRVYKATDVCSNYTNGYNNELEPKWRSNRRFHLLCMKCCKDMKETKEKLDERKDEEKKDNQCTACGHSSLMLSMNCQIAYTGDKLEYLDATPVMKIVANSNQPTVYSACDFCKKSKCDVNISHTFHIKCGMCTIPFGDEYSTYNNVHLLCTECSVRYTSEMHSLESLHSK